MKWLCCEKRIVYRHGAKIHQTIYTFESVQPTPPVDGSTDGLVSGGSFTFSIYGEKSATLYAAGEMYSFAPASRVS